MKNIYRESDKWAEFARAHRIKSILLVTYVITYALAMLAIILGNHYQILFMGGLLGNILGIVVGFGGQLLLLIFIPLFAPSYHRWRAELSKLFDVKVPSGIMHFCKFASSSEPVGVLIHIRDTQIRMDDLNRQKDEQEQKLAGAKRTLRLSELKLELSRLRKKFEPGSREASRIERAIRRGTHVPALESLLSELSAIEVPARAPQPAIPARDKVAELEQTFLLEEQEGQDAEATRLFLAAQQTGDRKQKRKLLVDAIAKLRSESKRRRELEEKMAARRQVPASP